MTSRMLSDWPFGMYGASAGAVSGVMCRETISVRWDGSLYDCDFNQQLEMDMPGKVRCRLSRDNVLVMSFARLP
eukprot:49558-Pyramimonas_sp.AAC.1